jgi:hypothetical protein
VRADVSDVRFDSTKHFSQLVIQQGRVSLDSDTNEQTAILLHYLRTLATDLIGRAGGPEANQGFAIQPKLGGAAGDALVDLSITPGRYYVDGILCELEGTLNADGNPEPISFRDQPDYVLDATDELPNLPFLVFLDVWERYVSAAEDDSIREVALGGPDTAGRARVIWQVRTFPLQSGTTCSDSEPSFQQVVDDLQPASRGFLRAHALQTDTSTDLCVISPDARYRGQENQLYRVEIHRSGEAWDGHSTDNGNTNAPSAATFKWSRDNGSNVFPIVSAEGAVVTLEYLGRDAHSDLQEGDLVEVQSDGWVLGDTYQAGPPPQLKSPPPLLEVAAIDRDTLEVTLTDGTQNTVTLPAGASLLRRWERSAWAAAGASGVADDGSVLVVESPDGTSWLALEAGVEVQFTPAPGGAANTYRSGDYWLIPARTETGDVRWPGEPGNPLPLPPQGVEHHYAPLAVLFPGDGSVGAADCRCIFLTDCERRAQQNQP